MQLSRLSMNRQAGDLRFGWVSDDWNPRLAGLYGNRYVGGLWPQAPAFAGGGFGRARPSASAHLAASLLYQARLATRPSSRAAGERPVASRDCLKLHYE